LDPLQAASSRGHKAIVQLLLEYSADVNAQGGNPLQVASSQGYKAIMQLLIENGVAAQA
jgi:ankyrin repeat protein